MLNAFIKFSVGICIRVLCFLILYRNDSSVGVAKPVIAKATDKRDIPHRPAPLYMPNRRPVEFSIDGMEHQFTPHADVLRVSPERS